MFRHMLRGLTLVALLSALATPAAAETVSRIRVMLHPMTADPGALPAATLAQLQAVTGTSLVLAATTRTGALEFTVTPAMDAAAVSAMLPRLRGERSVLWAEAVSSAPATVRIQSATSGNVGNGGTPGRKLMVRLVGDPVPDWATLLQRWSALAGATLAVDHQIDKVWVLTLAAPVPDAELAAIAALLETDPAVQYADPVRRAFAKLVPNDTLYPQQWALSDPVGGVNAPTAWGLTTGSASIAIAVVDTGVTAHPDFGGRFAPGYDFISDAQRANDGNGRDGDPSDPGDATGENECDDGAPAKPSSWHGTFVAGLIAANGNNGAGIAGMDWKAKIVPVRVLGKCGGTFDDITAGVLWAAGLAVGGTPVNTLPARVINMSLGGFTPCPQAMQDAINAALAQGAVVTVAAGNEASDAATSAPANCSGVITVGAATRQGDRAGYSNFGARLDLSAPGGDGNQADWVLSTWNDGLSAPGNPIYARGIGTSFAAPYVAGTASLMFSRNPNLTPGQVLATITGTVRPFAAGSACAQGSTCGDGLLDAGLAVQSTASASQVAPPGTVPVIEYYRADKDHYFMTADPAEAAAFDANALTSPTWPWVRTGQVFYAWASPASAPPGTPLSPVCRFYSPVPTVDSNLYYAVPAECAFVIAHYAGYWNLESPAAFYVILPDAAGNCIGGTIPVYRFFDNRQDANMRHTRDLTARREMLNKQWAPNGFGPNGVGFCSPV